MFSLNKTTRRHNNLLKAARYFLLFFLFAALLIPVSSTGSTRAQGQSQQHTGKFLKSQGQNAILNQYIVVLKDDLPRSDVASVAAELTLSHRGTTKYIYQHAIKGFSIQLPEAAAEALSHDPRVDFVEEDGEVYPSAVQFSAPWGLDRIDQRNLPLSSTYTYTTTGAGVNAYVIDTGIRFSHQEFSGRAFQGADFVGDGQNGNDCNGHGTHVAGTIGGTTYGVAKSVRLYSVRVFGCTGGASWSTIAAAVDWVTANHVKPAVVNMSLGGSPPEQSVDTAVRNSIASGVTYVIAAGNGTNNNCIPTDVSNVSPADVAEAITVSGTDISDNKYVCGNTGALVDVFAPAVNITSAWWNSDTATNTISGTSMATPHVAGAAALYLQTHPSATPSEVGGLIRHTATKNVVINPGPGSPNRLLYTRYSNGSGVLPLYRYWNPTATDTYYTINYNELGEGNLGWGIEKIACFAFSQQQSGTVPLYRYWNPTWGDHFYTTNFSELGNGAQGWTLEKIECYVYSSQLAGTVPLYRYWNSTIGNHYYTTDFNELGQGANGYVFEWVQCYVLPLN